MRYLTKYLTVRPNARILYNSTNSIAVLDPLDLVHLQVTSSRLLKLCRDNTLWRTTCHKRSSYAAMITRPRVSFSSSTSPLGESSSSDGLEFSLQARQQMRSETVRKARRLSRSIADWDTTDPAEKIDWYSEYIARQSVLTSSWFEKSKKVEDEIRGIAALRGHKQAVGAFEDGSVCVFDIKHDDFGRRRLREVSRGKPGTLFEDRGPITESSRISQTVTFSGQSEGVSVDSANDRAFFALGDMLNEVDLNTLQVVSQNKFAWPITALSRETHESQPLTIGTSWSLHIHDPRLLLRSRSRSPEVTARTAHVDPEDSIAFLPNYTKDVQCNGNNKFPRTLFVSSDRTPWRTRAHKSNLSKYAQVEPGPLSIVHQDLNSIFICGRFPSILAYDRRVFPKLEYVIHSGARLSALEAIPYKPYGSQGGNDSLIACGEYNGRGSLEIYGLPHFRTTNPWQSSSMQAEIEAEAVSEEEIPMERRRNGFTASWLPSTAPSHAHLLSGLGPSPSSDISSFASNASSDEDPSSKPFTSKNRQTASSSKLLSVATQGTRIVFSDADGGLRWVERDGRSLVRRWNINEYVPSSSRYSDNTFLGESSRSAWRRRASRNAYGTQGEAVARKILPLSAYPTNGSGRGTRGDGDLLVWTGEKIGLISFWPQTWSHGSAVTAKDDVVGLTDLFGHSVLHDEEEVSEKAEKYDAAMRRALERQTDEINWMRRLGMRA